MDSESGQFKDMSEAFEKILLLKQLYYTCKDESLAEAKISCSFEQFNLVQEIIAAPHVERWLKKLTQTGVEKYLELRDFVDSDIKGQILLFLSSETMRCKTNSHIISGVAALKKAFGKSDESLSAHFNFARECFNLGFHQNLQDLEWRVSTLYDENKKDLSMKLEELQEEIKALFLPKELPSPLTYHDIADFLESYRTYCTRFMLIKQMLEILEEQELELLLPQENEDLENPIEVQARELTLNSRLSDKPPREGFFKKERTETEEAASGLLKTEQGRL